MARPGIMLYFDILEPIRVLPDADKGRLLVAMLEYGQSGTVPEFDGMLALAWGFVKPKLDRDDESYKEAKVQRKYAAFCKKRNGLNLPKISFEEWLAMDNNKRLQMATEGNEPLRTVDPVTSRYPSTSTTGTPSTPTNTNTSAIAATAANATTLADAGADIDYVIGFGKDVVMLDGIQAGQLIGQMGKDTAALYVSKLADFIIRNNASVQDHYGTIVKWWNEDGKISKPARKFVPKGASGKLGAAELENIRRIMMED